MRFPKQFFGSPLWMVSLLLVETAFLFAVESQLIWISLALLSLFGMAFAWDKLRPEIKSEYGLSRLLSDG
jgi:hypothetical protein